MLVDEENEHTSGPGFSQQPVSEAYKPGKILALSALETTLHTLADWNGGLLDIAYYETTISSPLVLKALNSHASLATNTLYTLLIFVVAALPDYILAIFTIDRLGRKLIQCRGFALMTLAYGLIAFAPALSTLSLPFLLVYGVSYFFPEFGPNVTTFVYPAEVFPVMIRTTGHGIAAALGRCRALLGAFIFPYLLSTFHLSGAMGFAAIVSVLGLLRMDSQTNMRTGGNISSFSPRTCIG